MSAQVDNHPSEAATRRRRASVSLGTPNTIASTPLHVRVGVWNVQDFGSGPSGRWSGGPRPEGLNAQAVADLAESTAAWLAYVRGNIGGATARANVGHTLEELNAERKRDEELDAEVKQRLTRTDIEQWTRPREHLRYGLWRARVEDLEHHLASTCADVMVILEVQLKARRRADTRAPDSAALLQYDNWTAAHLLTRGVRNPFISSELIPDECFGTKESSAEEKLGDRFRAKANRHSNEPDDVLCDRIWRFCSDSQDSRYAGWMTLRWLVCWKGFNGDFTDAEIRKYYKLAAQRLANKSEKEALRAELDHLKAQSSLTISQRRHIRELHAVCYPVARVLEFEHLSERTLKAFEAVDGAQSSGTPDEYETDYYWLMLLDDQLWAPETDPHCLLLPRSRTELQSERMFQPNCERSGFSAHGADGGEGRGAEIHQVLCDAVADNPKVIWTLGPDTSKLVDETCRRDGETILVRCTNDWKVDRIECTALMANERPAFSIQLRKQCKEGWLTLLLHAGHAPAPERIPKSAKWFDTLGELMQEAAPSVVIGDFNIGKKDADLDFVTRFYAGFKTKTDVHMNILTSLKQSGEDKEMFSEPYDKVLVPKASTVTVLETMKVADRWRKAIQVHRYSDHCYVTSLVRVPAPAPRSVVRTARKRDASKSSTPYGKV